MMPCIMIWLVYRGRDQRSFPSRCPRDRCYLLDLNSLRQHPMCHERLVKRCCEGFLAKTIPNSTEQYLESARFLDNLPTTYWHRVHERVKDIWMDHDCSSLARRKGEDVLPPP